MVHTPWKIANCGASSTFKRDTIKSLARPSLWPTRIVSMNSSILADKEQRVVATCVRALNVRSGDWLAWPDYGFSPSTYTLFHRRRFSAPRSLPFSAGVPLLAPNNSVLSPI